MPVAIQTILWGVRPLSFLSYCQRRYGSTFTVRLPEKDSLVFLTDPHVVRDVFALQADEFSVEAATVFLEPFLGARSLLLMDGDAHRKERKLLARSFHGDGVAAHAAIIEEATLRDLATWPRGRAFSLRPHMQAITLEVILRIVFGFPRDDDFHRIYSAFDRFLEVGSSYLILLPPFRKDFGSRSPWGRFVRLRREIRQIVEDLIRQRRGATDLESRTDLLSLLLLARDEDGNGLDDASLFDELMTMLLAGQDTTATALSWAFDLLTHHPSELEHLVNALDAGDETFLDAVIKEVLRFRPVIPDVVRKLTRSTSIDGHELPAGTTLMASIALLHRRPEIFDDPLSFRPERFLEGSTDFNSWIPFGGGIRRCLGASFATLEIRIVLRTILGTLTLRQARRKLDRAPLIPGHGTRVIAEVRR